MTREEAARWLARLAWGSIGANVGELEDAFLALTAAPGSPTCRVCGWPFVSPHYPPCTGHGVPWKDVDALLRRPPLAVMLAVEVLCNHVEPGWENSKTIVRAWIDEERATRAALAGEK